MQIAPPFPDGRPTCFRSTVHGTIFSGRDRHVDAVKDGDTLQLIADPPVQTNPEVWVHLDSGDPIGHLPTEIPDFSSQATDLPLQGIDSDLCGHAPVL